MASHLVSSHQLSSYATPVNGDAGDATVVIGNDNTTVAGYDAHDADATIHVQSSSAAVFGATPAGTEGRKWMTQDTGAVYFYYDNGSAWVEVNYLRNTGGAITSSSATAFTVGRQGATDPVFQVDASTASVVTGIKIKGAAAAAGVAVSVISSGTNENVTFDAKGSGTISFATISTGAVVFGADLRRTGAAGTNRIYVGQTAGVARWNLILGNSTAETGSNAGSDLELGARTDAGTAVGTALTIVRSTMAATFGATIATAAPTGGAGAWLLGIANSVSPTSPNRTITVSIGGVLYYIHAKTTND